MYKQFTFFSVLLLILLNKAMGQEPDVIALEGVNIFSMTEERVMPKQRVLIAKGKIIKIEPATLPLRDSVALIIDGTDKYLIPGLSEMHYHFRSKDIHSDFKLFIANGITTVRNMAEGEGQDQIGIKADNLPKNIYLKLLEECQANNVQIVGHAQRALPLEYSTRMKSIEHIEEFAYLKKTTEAIPI